MDSIKAMNGSSRKETISKTDWWLYFLQFCLGSFVLSVNVYDHIWSTNTGISIVENSILKNTGIVFTMVKWIITTSVIYLGITLIYRYGSAMKERIKWWNTGAVLATLLIHSVFAGLFLFHQ